MRTIIGFTPTFRLPDYADCLARFIDELGLVRPNVLGLSFGAALALQLFDRRPQLPRTLVLAGAYAGWAGSLPPDEVERRLARLDADMRRPPEEWIQNYVPGMLTQMAPPDMANEVKRLMSAVRPAANQTMLRAMAEADLRDVLPRVDVPALVVCGDQDVRSPVEVGRALHERIPGSRLVILPNAGHLSNIEAAEPFNGEVLSFLESTELE